MSHPETLPSLETNDKVLEQQEAEIKVKDDLQKLKSDFQDKKNLLEVSQTVSVYLDTYGIDAIAGLFEGIGDGTIAVIMVAVHLYIAEKVGVWLRWKTKIVLAHGVDAVVGSIPMAGDIFDYFWKANKMSYKIIKEAFDGQLAEAKTKLSPEEYAELEKSINTVLSKVLDATQKWIKMAPKVTWMLAKR